MYNVNVTTSTTPTFKSEELCLVTYVWVTQAGFYDVLQFLRLKLYQFVYVIYLRILSEDGCFMICCDNYDGWYHGDCTSITPDTDQEMKDDNKEYICPSCT